jgi:hypothetical protein
VEQPSDPDGNQAEPDSAPDPADLPDPHSTRKPTPAGGLTYASDRPAPPDPTAAANTTDSGPPAATPIMVTKEHRRFLEFADAVRRKRYVGLCFGAPGVGEFQEPARPAPGRYPSHRLP